MRKALRERGVRGRANLYLLTAFDDGETISKLFFQSSSDVLFGHIGVNTERSEVIRCQLIKVNLRFSGPQTYLSIRTFLKVVAVIFVLCRDHIIQ